MNNRFALACAAGLLAPVVVACGGTEAVTIRDAGRGTVPLPEASSEDGASDDATLDATGDDGEPGTNDASADAFATDAAVADGNVQDAACDGAACSPACGAQTTCRPDGGAAYCASTAVDTRNCGACGHACAAGTVCNGGSCETTCGANRVDCNGGCVDGRSDPDHCGATGDCQGALAGVQCVAGKSCVAGSCVCDSKTTCGGVCVDTTSDAKNCGGCGNVCQGLCVNGGCATTCANLLALAPGTPNGTYLLDPDGIGPGAAYSAYCDMTHKGGGWTLALKADGANPAATFAYGSALWTNANTLNEASADHSLTEAKFRSFSQVVASDVLLELVDTSAGAATPPVNRQVIALQSPATLLSLVNGPFTPTALGRSAWTALTDNATLQLHCNVEGFDNYFSPPYARARIGMVGNEQSDCSTPDSALGFGVESGPGSGCYATDPSYSVGVVGGGTCTPSGPDKTFFGYVFVR